MLSGTVSMLSGVVDRAPPCEHQVVRRHPLEDVRERQEAREQRRRRLETAACSASPSTLEQMLPWVSITPFGSPVVPEV